MNNLEVTKSVRKKLHEKKKKKKKENMHEIILLK